MPGTDRQGAWASLMTLVVLGGLGGWGLWKATAPLATDRPTGRNASALRETMGKANARLWQDPLPALQRSFEIELARATAAAANDVAADAAADSGGEKPKSPSELALAAVQDDTQQVLRSSISRVFERDAERGVVLMPFRTSSDPTPESQENRVNYRYAIVSALASEDYIPRDRSHIGWFIVGADRPAEEVVPVGYEWWDPINHTRSPVLLLWIPSELLPERSQLRSLHGVLSQLVSKATLASTNLQVRYLTTGGSNALIGLVQEDVSAIQPVAGHVPGLVSTVGPLLMPQVVWGNVSVYDGFATISNFELLKRLPSIEGLPEMVRSGPLGGTYARLRRASQPPRAPVGELDASDAADPAGGLVGDLNLHSGAVVQRTIGTDEDLVIAIIDELERRGIHPGRGGDRLALVHEWDTAYGRALPETFRRICWQRRPSEPDDNEETRANFDRVAIPSFTFLRGVDGRVSGEDPPSNADAGRGNTGQRDSGLMSVLDVRAAAERPLGQSQLDYLRRLVETLQSEDREARRQGNRIAAIGVLASDTYDKQPIIQALRAGFPDAQYFTLDLHALLTHPKSYE
ncbi:MAG: hypothetical protein KDA22_01765, partial [Phycisphaerales bacterium]|nr:hypothetical protein [Phycisphaerales bacterium]